MTRAELIATSIAGVIAPFIVQLFKRWTGALDALAFLLAAIVSIIIAIIALIISGTIRSFAEVYQAGAIVLALATTVYKLFLADR